jgi:hypothetical protein
VTKDGTLIDEDSIDVAQPSQDANTEQVPLSLLLSRFIAETNARQSVSDAKSEVSASPIPAVDESELDGGLTSPGMPAAKAAAEAVRERRGDVAQLLAAIGPFCGAWKPRSSGSAITAPASPPRKRTRGHSGCSRASSRSCSPASTRLKSDPSL